MLNLYVKYGENMNCIKEVIKEKGLKLSWVAKKVDAHPSHLSMWIAEERYPSNKRLVKMARVLRCRVNQLYPNAKKRIIWEINNG